MKMNRMPVAMGLLVFSWLIAILGLTAGGYLIIFRPSEVSLLIKGFSILLGSLLLAMFIRMFGNIGQILFDLKAFIQKLLLSVSNDLRIVNQSANIITKNIQGTRDALLQGLSTLNQDLKSQFQNQTLALVKNLEELSAVFSKNTQILTQEVSTLNQDLKSQFQNQTLALVKNLEELSAVFSKNTQILIQELSTLNQDLKNQLTQELRILSQDLEAQFQSQTLSIVQNLLDLSNSIKTSLEQISYDSKDISKQIKNLETAKNNLEQIGFDSKDISQNIYKVKTFFEQIEKHLDLKK